MVVLVSGCFEYDVPTGIVLISAKIIIVIVLGVVCFFIKYIYNWLLCPRTLAIRLMRYQKSMW